MNNWGFMHPHSVSGYHLQFYVYALWCIEFWRTILSGHVSAEDELEDEEAPDAAVEEEEDEEEEDEAIVEDPQATDTVSYLIHTHTHTWDASCYFRPTCVWSLKYATAVQSLHEACVGYYIYLDFRYFMHTYTHGHIIALRTTNNKCVNSSVSSGK